MLKLRLGEQSREYFDISDPFFARLIEAINPHTLTLKAGADAPWALYQAIEYIVRYNIPGDIVECGVWAGGSMLLAAHALKHFGDTTRRIHLYDTFSGMPQPDAIDLRWAGVPTLPTWQQLRAKGANWGFGGTQDHVRSVVYSSGYPKDRFVFVEGMVEETLPLTCPEAISILRLDTDLYSSTLHELVHLYPRLSVGGILIIDDYGAYLGAQVATDEYFAQLGTPVFLSRINESVRLLVKPASPSA
jgi:O-methyltransferase